VEWNLFAGNPRMGQQTDAAWQGATHGHLLRIEQCNGIPSLPSSSHSRWKTGV
jgi:hypothetical protein